MPKKSPVFFLVLSLLMLFSCQQKVEVKQTTEPSKTTDLQKFELPKLPSEMNFCGQAIQINNFDIKERLDKEEDDEGEAGDVDDGDDAAKEDFISFDAYQRGEEKDEEDDETRPLNNYGKSI